MNLLDRFLIFLRNQKNKPSFSTIKNYKADISQFASWFEKESELPFDPLKITFQIIEQYKKNRNLSSVSVKRHLSSLRKFFNFLKIEGIIPQDPLEKKTVPAEAQALEDPWKLKNFKNFLYEYKKSNLTIKNYINDIRNFFLWLSEVSLTKYVWDINEKNLLNKVNPNTIEEYKQRLIASKFSPLTINRKLSSLRNYATWAKKQGFISSGHASSHAEFHSASNFKRILKRPPEIAYTEHLRAEVQNDKKPYSLFPPLRVAQKSLRGVDLLLDNLLILPIIKAIDNIQYLFWRATGKKVFKNNIIPNSSILDELAQYDNVRNIQREFYAPLSISVRYLPTYKKIWYHIRHTRPNWYKLYHSYSITHHFHFAILIVLSSAIGFGMYNGFFSDAQRKNAILGIATNIPPRILSFQGKLTDSQDNPIVNPANILFSIYSHENASAKDFLWQESDVAKPDSNGSFSILLGKNNPLTDSLFSQNSTLFLGVKVGSGPELTPRKPLATTSLSNNTQNLQGLEPITNSTKTSNVVLALDSQGNLSIAGEKAHIFQTIGGQFMLSGNVLSLLTSPGSNSDVEIVPDGLGKIDFSKPIHNSSNNSNVLSAIGAVEFDDSVAILATTSAQSAFTINQNSTGQLISAETLGTAKFTVDNDGTGMFAGDLGINGKYLTSSSKTFNLLNTEVTTLNIGGEATSLILGTASGSAAIQSNIILGNSNANTITFTGRVAQDSSLVPKTASGTNNLGSSALPWDNVYLNNIYAVKLDLQDSQSSTATAQIFNTNSGTDADGLLLKLGNASTDAVSNTNHFISFETSGIGIVGSIQGSGGKGVTYATSGIADFAEYLKKDKNQIIEYGSIVCMGDNGMAVKCDNSSNNILGVASERPAFLGGENLGDGSVAVGLIGQVETLVSINNGQIKAGDLLTASDIPGVAIKSTKAGQIIGKALEDLRTIDESKVVGFYDPDSKEYRSKTGFPNIPLKSNIIKIVKIYVLVNISWYDPSAYLTNAGELIMNSMTGESSKPYAILSPLSQTLTNIKTGLINASEIIANSLIVTTDNIIVNGQNLKDYIAQVIQESPIRQDFGGQVEIISPVVKTDQLFTNIISPLSFDSAITVTGNASFSGQLQTNQLLTNQLTTNDASISGTLRTKNIADIASYSGQFAYVEGLQAEQAQFNQGLMVFGATSLSDLSIAGQFSIGSTFFIADNSIEALGTDLSLQSLRQGGLSIMGGLVFIDTDGNLKMQGNLSIAGKLAVNIISPLPSSDLVVNNAEGEEILSVNQTGDIVASGSGTFAKINFSLIAPALAVSPTELIASSSAGSANISSYRDEVTIKNILVTDKSVIYITPVGTPSAQAPFLMRQLPTKSDFEQVGSFTVGIESPNKNPIPFNWLIVN